MSFTPEWHQAMDEFLRTLGTTEEEIFALVEIPTGIPEISASDFRKLLAVIEGFQAKRGEP